MRSCSMFNTTAPTFAKICRKIHALRCAAILSELILDKTRQNRRATRRFTEDFNAVLDKISHSKSGSDYSRLAIRRKLSLFSLLSAQQLLRRRSSRSFCKRDALLCIRGNEGILRSLPPLLYSLQIFCSFCSWIVCS